MIFATDLDRTIIYSKSFINDKNKNSVVEFEDGKIKSYMTKESKKMLDNLKQRITVIPCTTRSKEQFKRLKYFQDCKYAICSNGATIIIDGKVDAQWKFIMQENMMMCVKELREIEDALKSKDFVIDGNIRAVDCYFLFFKSDKIEKCKAYLEKNINKEKFYYSVSASKVYIFPNFISKKHALRYVLDRIEDKDIVVAGDSDVDFDMMKLATVGSFIPVHNTPINIDNNLKNITFIYNNGLLAGEKILQNINEILEKEEAKDVN